MFPNHNPQHLVQQQLQNNFNNSTTTSNLQSHQPKLDKLNIPEVNHNSTQQSNDSLINSLSNCIALIDIHNAAIKENIDVLLHVMNQQLSKHNWLVSQAKELQEFISKTNKSSINQVVNLQNIENLEDQLSCSVQIYQTWTRDFIYHVLLKPSICQTH